MRTVPILCRIGQFWLLLMAIGVASLYPLPPGALGGGLDKVVHLISYLVLFVSLDYALARGRRLIVKLASLLLFSWLIEIAQHFLPSRHYSLDDLLANFVGLLLGMLGVLFLRRISSR